MTLSDGARNARRRYPPVDATRIATRPGPDRTTEVLVDGRVFYRTPDAARACDCVEHLTSVGHWRDTAPAPKPGGRRKVLGASTAARPLIYGKGLLPTDSQGRTI